MNIKLAQDAFIRPKTDTSQLISLVIDSSKMSDDPVVAAQMRATLNQQYFHLYMMVVQFLTSFGHEDSIDALYRHRSLPNESQAVKALLSSHGNYHKGVDGLTEKVLSWGEKMKNLPRINKNPYNYRVLNDDKL